MAALSRPEPASTARLQPRLSALLEQVRETSRHAIRIARADAQHGEADAVDCLARLYDHWIRFSRGPQRLIRIASAAEVGALSLRHLQHGKADINTTDDPALRALYWTTVRRWRNARREVTNVDSYAARKPDGSQLDPEMMCGACRDLYLDARRRGPHAALVARGDNTAPDQQSGTLWCHCTQCTTQWVRRQPAHELFAAWTAIGGRP